MDFFLGGVFSCIMIFNSFTLKTSVKTVSKKKYRKFLPLILKLMQKSFSSGGDDDMEIDSVDGKAQLDEKERRKQMAAKRRAEMMAKMSNMQKAFLKTHQQFYDVEETDMTTYDVR